MPAHRAGHETPSTEPEAVISILDPLGLTDGLPYKTALAADERVLIDQALTGIAELLEE
jgi:hypothetical protein